MKKMFILFALLLSGCGGGSMPPPVVVPVYPNVAPGDADWALADQTYTLFDFGGFTGSSFDPVSGVISVDPSTFTLVAPERQTNLATTMPLDHAQVAAARVQTNATTAATAVDPSLSYVLVERRTQTTIGEAANDGAFLIDPPEPYITIHPADGETFTTLHHVIKPDGTKFDFTTRYQTVVTDITFDGFQHATVTTLIENPGGQGNNEMAYTWVFSGGEIAEEIIGWVAADNTIKNGVMLRRTGVGKNP